MAVCMHHHRSLRPACQPQLARKRQAARVRSGGRSSSSTSSSTSTSTTSSSSSSSSTSSSRSDSSSTSRRAVLLLGAAAASLPLQPLRASAAAAAACPSQQLLLRTPVLASASVQAAYDRYAERYDELDGGAASQALGFPQLRQQLLQQARGDVLEVGVGTGLNLPLYDASRLSSLTGVDLSQGMLREAASRVASGGAAPGLQLLDAAAGAAPQLADGPAGPGGSGSGRVIDVRLVQGDVARLPFRDASFDTVLDTFSLCVFAEPGAALREMARVLRPGGALLLLEHSRSDSPLLGAYQGATRALVASVSKGCDYGQQVLALVAGVPGLRLAAQQRHLAGTLVSLVAVREA